MEFASRNFLCALCVLCVLCVPALAETADPFAAYHQELDHTANAVLEAAQTPAGPASVSQVFSVVGFRVRPAVARVAALRPTLEAILREEGVPPETAAVVLVESGGRPTALSSKGALGLWQLMPDTARRYGLTVSPVKDERADVPKSTRAAARYLRDLHAQFGDWKLAFAAYNAGENAVQRAVVRLASSDFLRVSSLLPAETRNYVPAVMAAVPLFGGDANPSLSSRGLRFTPITGRLAGRIVYANAQPIP